MTRAIIRPDILCAWKGASLLVVDTHGDCGGEGLSGLYYREARFLRACRLEIDREPPWFCEAATIDADALQFTYTFPEVARYGGGGSGQSGDDAPRNARGLPQRGLNVRLTYRVRLNGLEIHAAIDNCARETLEFEAAWALDADFADIQEAQSGERRQRASVHREPAADALTFTYAHEKLPYETRVQLTPPHDWRVSRDRAAARVRLAPFGHIDLMLGVTVSAGDRSLADDDVREREACLEQWRARFTRVTAPRNTVFEAALAQAVGDFGSFPLLDGAPDEWLTLQAGVPLYPALFGRDAITAGWQAGYVDNGESLDAALTRLGRLQSNRLDEWHDEEPGRIPYQVRSGPLAILDINPYAGYYADFASPLMFVIALANLYAWTGSRSALDRHWDTARRILDWARERGDLDGDGYLEYLTRSREGTKNQGWKDSGDAIVYEDGSIVRAPIATCEIQSYWFAAQQLMGVLCWMRGERDDARAHLAAAADLKERFNRDWWVEEDQCVALAMDPDKRLVRAATSNAGHCIASGIVDTDHLPAIVERLFAPDMFSGWGIRTLSSAHRAYSPLSYHRGTMWAVEQATILFGLRRFGFDARAHDLARAMFDLACLYPRIAFRSASAATIARNVRRRARIRRRMPRNSGTRPRFRCSFRRSSASSRSRPTTRSSWTPRCHRGCPISPCTTCAWAAPP